MPPAMALSQSRGVLDGSESRPASVTTRALSQGHMTTRLLCCGPLARERQGADVGGGDGHRGAADAAVIHMHGARGARVCRRACARARGRRSSVAPLGRPREPGPEGDEGEEQEHRQGESSRPPITSPAPRPSAGRAARARRLAASRGPSGRSIGRVGLQYPSILAAGLCGGGLLGGALI